jgi:uncharacterized protein (DUF736 family)
MPNIVGFVIRQADGRYKARLRVISPKADNGILLNIQEESDDQPLFRVVVAGAEIGAGWTSESNASRMAAWVSLSQPQCLPL